MKSTVRYAFAVSALLLGLTACGDMRSSNSSAEPGSGSQASGRAGSSSKEARSQGSGANVVMELIQFKPDDLKVTPGTTVIWNQKDPGAHTVTSGRVQEEGGGVSPRPDGKFDSGEIASGDTFEHQFSEPGVYSYFCSIHPATMRGEVKVS